MEDSSSQVVEQTMAVVTTYGLQVLGALVILILGWMIAGWARGFTERALSKTDKVDVTLRQFLASMVRYAILVFTVVAVLDRFGVETTSLIAIVGAAGLAIGLALQGTLSNVSAGVMLLLFRPFKVGDYVEGAGQAGSVKSITLFVTELATPDNVQIIVPNSQLWGAAIKNYSFHETRRVDLLMGIAYEDKIDDAVATINKVIEADSRAHKDPAPMVAVVELADSSVNLTVRVWCDAGDYWPLKFDLTKALKERFDSEGISIPYPQQVVHMHQAGTN